ncbi:TolC family protein [Enhygromyxa salina]|uniref:Cobalt-zinc-cadmium resistance protein CzcC n=1 Tax=Enhygromyxa salina TaxID=215803 RepID=A0A2S9XPN3_9BACT|nr:TolC family protein [Enhygromyxa salina]PRP94827.1 Cobalt-zinc-cadmium resistance protein CzcC precursor [Enhygromyxa salina]
MSLLQPETAAALAVPQERDGGQVFRPSAELGLEDLQEIVGEGLADLEAAALRVDLARADVRQSRLLPNPILDLEYGTIPFGTTNPADLDRPFANIPNYGVGVAYPIELGKRRPRIQRDRALERGARAELDAVTRSQALELAATLGELATAILRLEGFEEMVADSERSVAAAEVRVATSFGVPLDVDRLRVELTRTEQLVLTARSDISRALADCATRVGRACERFVDSSAARAYLEAWIAADPGEVAIEERPDLRALSEYGEAASASERLARAQRIPDPTLRVGYTHDRFWVSGNQMNSFTISLSFALPTFDRGQAQRQAAEAQTHRLGAERSKRVAATQAQLPDLARQVELERDRQVLLRDDAIPAAKRIASAIEDAAESRLTTITEVVQARRTLRELLLAEAEAYAAAYEARLELLRVLAPPNETKP